MEGLIETLMTGEEASALTGLNTSTLRKLAWQRKIRSFKILGRLRFKRSDLEELVIERPAVTTASRRPSAPSTLQQSSGGKDHGK